ncbi:MAG: sigma-54-dependent Fis family transcriptional regulator [Nitrospirae bacterium]|nr:MAG: sigma-54-dependent Fis family transcriptional regulator [Nitrospirota bacterium]
MTVGRILVVDDEKSQRDILTVILEGEGYTVQPSSNVSQALALYRSHPVDVVLTDLSMPERDGLALLDDLMKLDPEALVVLITAHGTVGSAVEAMKKGAFDYLEKPLDREELLITVARAFEKLSLVKENRHLRQQLHDKFKMGHILGHHALMEEVFRVIRKVAPSQTTVLITGESGTGKELVARALHAESSRKERPFRALNCAAIPETLIESELFGYEKGAFTGAQGRQIGLFEAVDEGTLFLDEIGDLSLPLQAKLLRVLQEKEIRRIGGREDIKVNVRVVAATNRKLAAAIKQGTFREDLFYRLNVVSVHLPPLRDRATDIPELVDHFLKKFGVATGKAIKGITTPALRALMDYPWPGNVRELESVVERAVLLCEGERIDIDDFPAELRSRPTLLDRTDFELPNEGFCLEEFERQLLEKAMARSNGVIAKAAKMLGLSYKTMQYRLEKFQLGRGAASRIQPEGLEEQNQHGG